FNRPKTSAPMRSPTSAETAGDTSMSKTSLHSSSNSNIDAKLSALNMDTTWTSDDAGQYSAITLTPAGYCQSARRAKAASLCAPATEERKRSKATYSMSTSRPNASAGALLAQGTSA